ncbi:MAG TPA: DUF1508 domain-containing protein [Terrimicrobiaceae bacterium]
MSTEVRLGYHIWKSKSDGNWHWNYKAKNGDIVAGGGGYKSKPDCLHAIGLLRTSGGDKIWNLTPED